MTQEQFLIAARKRVAKLMDQQVVTSLPTIPTVRPPEPAITANELAELIKAVATLEDAQANSNLYKRDHSNEEEDDQW